LGREPLDRLDRFYTGGQPHHASRPALNFEMAGGEVVRTPHGATLVLTRRYAWDALPAGASFEAVRAAGWAPASLDTRLPDRAALCGLACIDIETTGLSLGAGTVAFLVGVIHGEETGAVLKQFLIRDFQEEAAQQTLLAEHMGRFEVLCTYNGARFDLPILRSRAIMHRIDAPWLEHPHLDLLYPVRSVWRKIWPDCRLATAEMRLLGVVRHQDCEGWEVPLRFRQFLHDQSEATLADVLEHNAQDLVSLYCLTAALLRLYSDDFAGFGLSQTELLCLARSVYARGRRDTGLRLYAHACNMGRLDPEFDRHMRHYVRLLKKQSLWDEARRVWQNMAASSTGADRFWAFLEEAKFLEHRLKVPAAALEATLRAADELAAFTDRELRSRLADEVRLREIRLRRMQKPG